MRRRGAKEEGGQPAEAVQVLWEEAGGRSAAVPAAATRGQPVIDALTCLK